MNIRSIDLSELQAVAGGDACARSGLTSPGVGAFSTLYTGKFDDLYDFYESMLGEANVRFRGEGIAAFRTDGGEIVLQNVSEMSPFAPMIGKQSIGLAVADQDAFRELTARANGGNGHNGNANGHVHWDSPAALLKDPEGNLIHIVQAK